MKWIYWLVCLLVVSIGGAGAVPQNVTLGQCNVSFDLGFDEPINGTYAEVVHSEIYWGNKYDKYEFDSLDDNMEVGIKVFVDPDDRWGYWSDDDWEDELSLRRTDDCHIDLYPREFDGNAGHIFVFETVDDFIYLARFNALNNTVNAFVGSAYPWDEGTTNLLNSIHFERVAV